MTGGNLRGALGRRTEVKKLISILSLMALVLTACGSGDAGGPSDGDDPAPPTSGPGDPGPPTDQVPGDKGPVRYEKLPDNAGQAFIVSSDLLIMESFPIQVALAIEGSLPTPCHGLGWVQEDDGATISVTVFSVEPGPAVTCIAMEEPFELSVPLGDFADEDRSVELNGDVVGEFSS